MYTFLNSQRFQYFETILIVRDSPFKNIWILEFLKYGKKLLRQILQLFEYSAEFGMDCIIAFKKSVFEASTILRDNLRISTMSDECTTAWIFRTLMRFQKLWGSHDERSSLTRSFFLFFYCAFHPNLILLSKKRSKPFHTLHNSHSCFYMFYFIEVDFIVMKKNKMQNPQYIINQVP